MAAIAARAICIDSSVIRRQSPLCCSPETVAEGLSFVMKPIPTPKYSGAVTQQLRKDRAARASMGEEGASASVPLALPYLSGYAPSLQNQVRDWLFAGKAGEWLLRKYPQAHAVRTDRALYDYVDALKAQYLRNAGQLHKVAYDSRIHVVHNALGLHTRRAIVHGGRLNARHEIHVAAMFKQAPDAFLRMICVHELAHTRHFDHSPSFWAEVAKHDADYKNHRKQLKSAAMPWWWLAA